MSRIALLALVAISHFSSTYGCVTKLHARQDEPFSLPPYNYEGTTGAVNWHGIKPEYATCATGQNQSPINIIPGDLQTIPAGEVTISLPNDQTPIFQNLGINVQVAINGTTVISGKNYKLLQFHFHTPSEHRIEKEHFPVEAHMVHQAEDDPNELAVIGFVFEVTCRPQPPSRGASVLFSRVLREVSSITNPGDETSLQSPRRLGSNRFESAVGSLSFYTYGGSLTTPPCTEGVTWLVSTETLSLSVNAYNDLKDVVNFNSRFDQGPLGSQNLISLAAEQFEALS